MRLSVDQTRSGLLTPDGLAARRFLGPLLGPAALNTLAVIVELVNTNHQTTDIDPAELAARVGISETSFHRSLGRLSRLNVITHTADDLIAPHRISPPTADWRNRHYPQNLNRELATYLQRQGR